MHHNQTDFHKENGFNRRQFLKRGTQAGFALAAGSALVQAAEDNKPPAAGPRVGAFTKSFQDWSIEETCRRFRSIGLDGLDLTVRPGGHIEPKNVVAELPQAVEAARKHEVAILFLTTGITDPDEDADHVLQTAAEQGIDRVKLGYYRYKPFGTLRQQLDDVRARLAKVVKLAARYQILPCVHIHSGSFLPSHGTQLYELIRDFSPDEIGAYVDPLHMTKEGGGDGWRQGLDLLAPWISLVSVKNFAWEPGERDKFGQRQWKTKTVPVADGVCPLPEFVATLKKTGYNGIYSLHSEYKGSHTFRNLTTEECLQQTAHDLKFLRRLL